ncbi:MAG TPA: TetR/AcrR family transcriptional regulator [Bryobacteraceae bacterium]|nr:TetR/AcrR family transcriptional regulator [Bryobacteraceae bacterium]
MNQTVAQAGTKERILDASERLFAEHGFEATSLRAITTEAGVNLAAVNYHFQSKDALINAVIGRRIGPVNRRRLEMLDEIEAHAGAGPLPVGPVIEAFIRPVLEIPRTGARHFRPMVGRVFTEPEEFVARFFKEHLAHVADRFFAAFRRAQPSLPEPELLWRAHFLIGAMAHTMTGNRLLEHVSKGLCDTNDVDSMVDRFVHVFTAVFQLPLTEAPHAH